MRSPSLSIRARIRLLVALAVAATLGLCWLMLERIEQSRLAIAWVDHTEAVLGELQAYSEHVTDAETAQRGYLLTGRSDYLAPYREAVSGHQAHLERLLALTADNPAQRPRLQRMGKIVAEKLDLTVHSVRLAEAGDMAQAVAIVRDGRGKILMDEFKRVRGDIADAEKELLVQRRQAVDAENAKLLAIVYGSGIAIVVLLLMLGRNIAGRIAGPLHDLLQGIGSLAEGNLESRVPVAGRDEIGQVAAAFNTMADHLQDARQKLHRNMDELERSNRELDSFAYVASHDLKSPLRAIRSLATWIAEDVRSDKSGAETMDNLMLLDQRVNRLDTLLDGLLLYSRVGRTAAPSELVNTQGMIEEIANSLNAQGRIDVVCSAELPVLDTRRAPLDLIFRNLIDNALKHGDGGKITVRISARDLGEMLEFRVADDGPGIDPAYHDKIFALFQTLKPRDQVEGSGIGLTIVKKAVEGNGGSIRVESQPPLRGAAFLFTWPKSLRP